MIVLLGISISSDHYATLFLWNTTFTTSDVGHTFSVTGQFLHKCWQRATARCSQIYSISSNSILKSVEANNSAAHFSFDRTATLHNTQTKGWRGTKWIQLTICKRRFWTNAVRSAVLCVDSPASWPCPCPCLESLCYHLILLLLPLSKGARISS